MNAVELVNVGYTYPDGNAALKEISFTVAEGYSVAILGSNGAGKSTLLDLLFGWKRHEGIQIFGKPLVDYGRKELGRAVALVPQSEHYNFSFTLLEYVLFGRSPYLTHLGIPTAHDTEIAEQALEMVGLSSMQDKHITTLSGGEHQLLLLARAIAQQSKILLLDEPTSALDPANRRRVLTLLSEISKSGRTLMFTTHDANLAYELATHVAMLKKGRLLAFGTKEQTVTSELLSSLYDTPMHVSVVEGNTLIH